MKNIFSKIQQAFFFSEVSNSIGENGGSGDYFVPLTANPSLCFMQREEKTLRKYDIE